MRSARILAAPACTGPAGRLPERMPAAAPAKRTTIRWGILGCGDVTEVKSGPGFKLTPGSELVAVMRRNGALAADYARRHGVPRWYDDAKKLVDDPEVDAVYVATPPGAHLDGALLAAAAGKPCYVEKPMARRTTECDAMIAAFTRAGQKLFVAYYRRALPRFLKVRELLEGGAIGRLTTINYRMAAAPAAMNPPPWRLDAKHSGGGLLLDVGSHVLVFLDFCLGPLEGVHGQAARLGADTGGEDVVAMTFRTADGALGAATWNFASFAREDVLEFSGIGGRLTLNFFSADPVRLETANGIEHLDFPYPPHVAQPLIQTVVADLLGRGTCPSTADSARRTTVVLDRVLNDFYRGREDAFWTRPESWEAR